MKFLLSDRLMLVFVSPVTFKIVKCDPNGLEEIFVEQHASLHRDIKKSLRRIHKSISSADQIANNQIAEDNKRLLKKVEDLSRNSKPSDSTTTSDVTINVAGGQAMKQSKAQVNIKTSIKYQVLTA